MDNLSTFRICSFNLRGFAKNDPLLQLEKLLTAVKRHDLIRLLDTHMNQEEVDVLIKNNKQTFKDFYDPVLIPSLTRGIMVLLRKSSPFKMVKTEVVTQNCLAIKLKSASNQEIEVAFVYNPNDESDKISNLRKALDHLADNGAKNQMIIGDYNTSMNFELDYVDYSGDPHKTHATPWKLPQTLVHSIEL